MSEIEKLSNKPDLILDSDDGDNSSTKISVNTSPSDNERDEIEEVQKFAQKDTRRIFIWRFVIFGVLLATACTVTVTTWKILQKEQEQSFISAFEKFAATVGDAAVLQQHILRDAFRATANAISVDARRSGISWPYYTTPYYELNAGQALKRSRAEVGALFTFVEEEEREDWLQFTTDTYQSWSQASHISKYGNLDRLEGGNYNPYITSVTPNGYVPDVNRSEYWAMWLYSPPPIQFSSVNWNVASVPDLELNLNAMKVMRGESVLTSVRKFVSAGTAFSEAEHDNLHSQYNTDSKAEHPHCFLWTPIYEDPEDVNSTFVAFIGSAFAWDFSLRDLLPNDVEGVIAVISNTCNQTYTYDISGADAFYLGDGDHHETKYDGQKRSRDLSLLTHPLKDTVQGDCRYTMDLYPSSKFEEDYDTNTPEVFAGVVAVTFVLVAVVFVVYDILVHHRNMRLVQNAARSNAVVSALFPGKIRDQILEQQQQQQLQRGTKSKMKSFLVDGNDHSDNGNRPLADLFLETTIMFADITGFTAWASVREPSQVFTLLETVYGSFDEIAKSRKVFKVETVGDCYVAAAGIPEPRKDHATVIIRFARDCINRLHKLSAALELSLGPGTAELGIRVGVHSGPVTAGVLRGERARFQLFGDTMNVTARMESSSEPGRIQVSSDTAEILRNSGKEHWLEIREELVNAKGKGTMQTYWACVKDQPVPLNDRRFDPTALQGELHNDNPEALQDEKKRLRLIDWNVETLSRFIKQILARRQPSSNGQNALYSGDADITCTKTDCPLDEVKEVIMLPEFDSRAASMQVSPEEIYIEQKVLDQLRSYVTTISHLYYRNPFHNFEHASHVVMSVTKLLSRIVAPDTFHDDNSTGPETNVAQSMHDHTYGITSDPLTQFACAFSALIHDVDHRGVPNGQLITENEELGKHYRGRSVAEQNSLDLSWELLMDNRYSDLRAALCQSTEELKRLRELVVNGVLATDIMDKDLKALRNDRWTKAFAKVESCTLDKESAIVDRNRKATIVIEHLIQASDVAHTMQHWHVYRQWNQRLFEEMYVAYKAGRADKDPSEFWYEGEIGFFDFYIIPLAKKLKECGVFGVSSGEYLNYAENNRAEWERRGKDMIAEMVDKLKVKSQQSGDNFKLRE